MFKEQLNIKALCEPDNIVIHKEFKNTTYHWTLFSNTETTGTNHRLNVYKLIIFFF